MLHYRPRRLSLSFFYTRSRTRVQVTKTQDKRFGSRHPPHKKGPPGKGPPGKGPPGRGPPGGGAGAAGGSSSRTSDTSRGNQSGGASGADPDSRTSGHRGGSSSGARNHYGSNYTYQQSAEAADYRMWTEFLLSALSLYGLAVEAGFRDTGFSPLSLFELADGYHGTVSLRGQQRLGVRIHQFDKDGDLANATWSMGIC